MCGGMGSPSACIRSFKNCISALLSPEYNKNVLLSNKNDYMYHAYVGEHVYTTHHTDINGEYM